MLEAHRDRIDKLFLKFDKNDDKKLSRRELRAVRQEMKKRIDKVRTEGFKYIFDGYSKKYIDGLFGFLLTATAYQTALRSNKSNSILAPFFISTVVVLHGGEIYGSYRSAKYYTSKKISY